MPQPMSTPTAAGIIACLAWNDCQQLRLYRHAHQASRQYVNTQIAVVPIFFSCSMLSLSISLVNIFTGTPYSASALSIFVCPFCLLGYFNIVSE